MRILTYASFGLLAVIVPGGCAEKGISATDNMSTETTMPRSGEPLSSEHTPSHPQDVIEITGTVSHKDLEGGFFAIDADDGNKYDPINLPEPYRKDGLKVKLTARVQKDMASFHMYGVIIEVVHIEAR